MPISYNFYTQTRVCQQVVEPCLWCPPEKRATEHDRSDLYESGGKSCISFLTGGNVALSWSLDVMGRANRAYCTIAVVIITITRCKGDENLCQITQHMVYESPIALHDGRGKHRRWKNNYAIARGRKEVSVVGNQTLVLIRTRSLLYSTW